MQKRKLIEQGFGWAKFIGPIRQVMVFCIKKFDQVFTMAVAAYNLTRMRTLGQVRPELTRIVEKRTFTSAAELRAVGISAAC